MTAPHIDLSFPHSWQAEILAARPLILPPRHFTYPAIVEEVERGALEILIHPRPSGVPGHDSETGESTNPSQPHLTQAHSLGAPGPCVRTWESTNSTEPDSDHPQTPGVSGLDSETGESTNLVRPFLATCALGFRDSSLPTGVWSAPRPEDLCAVAGGYAYLIDTRAPERFAMLDYRPVFAVMPAVAQGLLLFAGSRSLLAWSKDGRAWESPKLSDEGITITSIEGNTLHGLGWNLMSDKETPFALDLRSGKPHA